VASADRHTPHCHCYINKGERAARYCGGKKRSKKKERHVDLEYCSGGTCEVKVNKKKSIIQEIHNYGE